MVNSRETDSQDRESPLVRVECYAGHRADTEPRRFHLGSRAVLATEIIDRWLEPACRCFKVRGDDGGIYLLRHYVATDRWDLTLFGSGRREDTGLSSA